MKNTFITTTINPKKMPEHLGTDDPLVLKTSWNSTNSYGQRAQTHDLVKVSDERMEFRLRYLQFLPLIIAMVVTFAASLMLLFGSHIESSGSLAGAGSWVNLMAGIFIGFILFKRISRLSDKIIIDKNISKQVVNLKNVHAVQIIKKLISGSNHGARFSYYKHEIYLVYDNAERKYLVGHAQERVLTEQAERLSEFLNIPLWDGRSNVLAMSSGVFDNYKGSLAVRFFVNGLLFLVLLFFVSAIYLTIRSSGQ